MGAQARPRVKSVWDLSASGDLDYAAWAVRSHFMSFSSCLFLHFKTSPHLLQLFWQMLQSCFAVKLQKCWCYDTSLDFPSTCSTKWQPFNLPFAFSSLAAFFSTGFSTINKWQKVSWIIRPEVYSCSVNRLSGHCLNSEDTFLHRLLFFFRNSVFWNKSKWTQTVKWSSSCSVLLQFQVFFYTIHSILMY